MTKTDRQIKAEATKRENVRVFDNMILPARDIIAECEKAIYVKRAWNNGSSFGWSNWEKI